MKSRIWRLAAVGLLCASITGQVLPGHRVHCGPPNQACRGRQPNRVAPAPGLRTVQQTERGEPTPQVL